MDIEEYINRSDVLTYFEDVMYSDYFTWFIHMPAFGWPNQWNFA